MLKFILVDWGGDLCGGEWVHLWGLEKMWKDIWGCLNWGIMEWICEDDLL